MDWCGAGHSHFLEWRLLIGSDDVGISLGTGQSAVLIGWVDYEMISENDELSILQ